MPTRIPTSSLALLFTAILTTGHAFLSSLDQQFAPGGAAASSPPSSAAVSATPAASSSINSLPASTGIAGPATSCTATTSDAFYPAFYIPTPYTYDPITANLQGSSATSAPVSFYPCTPYHVPNTPGQSVPATICEYDGSTFDLSSGTFGTTSTLCGYTVKLTSTLEIPPPSMTIINNPAATPAGNGVLNVFLVDSVREK